MLGVDERFRKQFTTLFTHALFARFRCVIDIVAVVDVPILTLVSDLFAGWDCVLHWLSTFHSILRAIIKLCNYKAISDSGNYYLLMATTIQVSDELADKLYSHKCRGESYDDVLKRMLELDEL